MSIVNRRASPVAAGEELGPPVVPLTQPSSPLRRFWSAANLTREPGRPGSTLLRHTVLSGVAFFLLTALTANLQPFDNFLVALIAAYLCAAAGLTVLVGQNGQLSLGHGAIMAVGAYSVALMQIMFGRRGLDTAGWSIFASFSVGILAALVVGLIVGVAAARLRGPYLAGVTLAFALIVQPITQYFRETFNGDQGLAFNVPDKPAALGPVFRPDQWNTWIAGGAAILVMLLLANLGRSRIGRNFRAVRDDEIAARLCGIHVARTRVLAFVVSAGAAGLAGGVLAMLQLNAQPGAYGLNVSLFLFVAIIIGGLGSLSGAVWGAVAIALLPQLTKFIGEQFNSSPALTERLNGNLAQMIFGVALIIVMIAAPGGVQGLLNRVRRWSVARIRGARR
jgi:branched-chain amino acid transport system permease protein